MPRRARVAPGGIVDANATAATTLDGYSYTHDALGNVITKSNVTHAALGGNKGDVALMAPK